MWNLEKLNKYISNGIEENVHLDYKSAGSLSKTEDKKKAEISKDVSAFANSDGGIIIYGIKEFDEKEKRHLPERLDPINGLEITKEWLEQIINSSISPRILNIKITPVQVSEPSHNQIVFVVEIPKGHTAHQAKDKRYYRRFNFESQMMDDWEIKDIINRNVRTDIRLSFYPHLPIDFIQRSLDRGDSLVLEIDVWFANRGNKVANLVDCYFNGTAECAKYIIKPLVNRRGFQFRFSNEVERKIKIGDVESVISIERNPILPNTSRMIDSIKIKSDFILRNEELTVQIATDDGSKNIRIKGKEILEK